MNVRPEKEYDSEAAVGVLYIESRFLVIQRSQHVVAPGKFCFPGGRVEANEEIREALIREFREELQLEVTPIREIWNSITGWKCKVHWWLVSSSELTNININQQEVELCCWLTLDELLENEELLESNREFLERLKEGEITFESFLQ